MKHLQFKLAVTKTIFYEYLEDSPNYSKNYFSDSSTVAELLISSNNLRYYFYFLSSVIQ